MKSSDEDLKEGSASPVKDAVKVNDDSNLTDN